MKPTNKFRWVVRTYYIPSYYFPFSGTFVTPPYNQGMPQQVMVLQQWHGLIDLDGNPIIENGEWRDVPVEVEQ